MAYKLRLHLNRANCSYPQVKEWISSKAETYLICREYPGQSNEHIHAYFKHHTTKIQALRTSLKKTLIHSGAKGNAVYSLGTLKECDTCPLKFIAYLLKDDDYIHRNIPPKWIEEAMAHDKAVKALKAGKIRVIDIIAEKCHPYLSKDYPLVYMREILHLIIQHYVDAGTVFNQYKVLATFNYLMCKNSQDYLKQFVAQILDKT